jgi:hypothetical protein
MTHFKLTFLLVIVLVVVSGCGSSQPAEGLKTEIIDGVTHVYTTATPLHGDVALELEEMTRIDSMAVDRENPPAFGQYQLDNEGNAFLAHRTEPHIYKFDKNGSLLTSFGKKGEGPGEFPRSIYEFQVAGGSIWAANSRKIVRFDLEGNYISQHIFERNVTLQEMANQKSIIGNYYFNDRTDERARVCAHMDLTGKEIAPLMSDPAAGFTRIRVENLMYSFFHRMITNDIMHAFDHETQMVYLFLTNEPVIFRKTLNGDTDLVIHRDIEPVKPTEADVEEFKTNGFSRWPQELRQAVARSLPPHYVFHNNIYLLPSGHFILRRITGYQKYHMDIFDHSGQFIYTIKPGPLYPDFSRVGFVKGKLAVFQEEDDRDIFILYTIKNLPRIFQ